MAVRAKGGSHAGALRALSIAMGVFLIFMGLDKIGWLMDGGILTRRLLEARPAVQRGLAVMKEEVDRARQSARRSGGNHRNLGPAFEQIGFRFGQIRFGPGYGDLVILCVDLDQHIARFDALIVPDRRLDHRTADASADGVDGAVDLRVVGGLAAGGVLQIEVRARRHRRGHRADR